MWKIFFTYSDGSKCTLTGKQKDIDLRLARKYHNQYGIQTISSMYQQYPKKNNEAMDLMDKIEELESEESK